MLEHTHNWFAVVCFFFQLSFEFCSHPKRKRSQYFVNCSACTCVFRIDGSIQILINLLVERLLDSVSDISRIPNEIRSNGFENEMEKLADWSMKPQSIRGGCLLRTTHRSRDLWRQLSNMAAWRRSLGFDRSCLRTENPFVVLSSASLIKQCRPS